MGFFDYFKKEKMEERATARRNKRMGGKNDQKIKKLEEQFVIADNLLERMKTNQNYLRVDESTLQSLINGLWEMIYSNPISTFV